LIHSGTMFTEEYEFICERLNSPQDAEKLHERMDYPLNMLYNILAKKIVRRTMRDFYKVKRNEAHLVRRWDRGESILRIARSIRFSPVLTATFIFSRKGFSKSEVRSLLRYPDEIADKRIKREIKAVLKADFVYSPASSERQAENGQRAEDNIEAWLKKHNINYMTEKQSREQQREKTPDFLFRKLHNIDGIKAHWIESKASFGDAREMGRDYRRQLKPYTEHFGQGIVVYWYGFLEDVEIDKRVKVVDARFFSHRPNR
jgi:hypothetical protein